MRRACADCEKEHGILNRGDASGTHGQCRRHFMELMKDHLDDPEFQKELATISDESFCPDLGPVPVSAR